MNEISTKTKKQFRSSLNQLHASLIERSKKEKPYLWSLCKLYFPKANDKTIIKFINHLPEILDKDKEFLCP